MNAGPFSVVRYALPTKAKVLSLLVLVPLKDTKPIKQVRKQLGNYGEAAYADSGDEEDYNVFQHGELL